MKVRKFSELNEAIQLKNRIENWRKSKTSKKMPETLWTEAVSKAKSHNPSSIAKFLNIGHADLIKRIPQYTSRKLKSKSDELNGFIELPVSAEFQTVQKMEVHLTNRNGQSATIRHSCSSADWENLFTGWFKASQSVEQGQRS